MTSAAELRELDDQALVTRLTESREELFNLRFQLVTGRLDNSSRVGQVRREVARIHTVLREREIAAAEALDATGAAPEAAAVSAGGQEVSDV